MKKMKVLLPFAVVGLMLSLGACGGPGGGESGKSTTSSAQQLPKIKVTTADDKTSLTLIVGETGQVKADQEGVTWASTNTAVATVDGEGLVAAVSAGSAKITAKKDGYKDGSITITVNAPADPLLQPLERTYTESTPAQNSAGKDYIPLTDATANKVGVKIAITNWEIAEGSPDTTKLGTDGGIEPKNDHSVYLAYKLTAPKAGTYQLVMTGKCSSGDGASKTLDERAFSVKVNGEEVDVVADRNPVTTTSAAFVAAPRVTLRGTEEDIIAVSCSDYRIKFDTASFLLFNEI